MLIPNCAVVLQYAVHHRTYKNMKRQVLAARNLTFSWLLSAALCFRRLVAVNVHRLQQMPGRRLATDERENEREVKQAKPHHAAM